ncbi:MAG: hypothetical protein NTW61_09545 [Candidatus Melainabacteria bacterium]|jgi:hypothetical protein|nr:hypothetical protein [Candidatus Melainabacteria bacterium]
MSIASILKNPANKALLTCPEMLVGLGVLVGIIFGGNELVIKPLSASGTDMEGKITSSKTNVDAKKQFSETLKKLQASGKDAQLSFLTVKSPEFLSVTLFDYIENLKRKIGKNNLNLAAPHNQVRLISLEAAAKASTDSSSTNEKLDLNDPKNAPFQFNEAKDLKDGKLSAYAGNYTLKAKGTYAGLLALLSSLLNTSPVISVNALSFALDTDAPSLSTFRPGVNLLPPPTATAVSTIEGSQGAESGSGGGTSVLFSGSSGALPPEPEKNVTTAVQLPPSAAPVVMTLNFRVYVKETKGGLVAPSSATSVTSSAVVPAGAGAMPMPSSTATPTGADPMLAPAAGAALPPA